MSGSVGYVLRMFPQASETFVANEVAELERRGCELRLYSYRRPAAVVPHALLGRIRAPVEHLPDPLYRHPRRLLRSARAIRRLDPEAPIDVAGSSRADRDGITHARTVQGRDPDATTECENRAPCSNVSNARSRGVQCR